MTNGLIKSIRPGQHLGPDYCVTFRVDPCRSCVNILRYCATVRLVIKGEMEANYHRFPFRINHPTLAAR
jgi:hypothetical protein